LHARDDRLGTAGSFEENADNPAVVRLCSSTASAMIVLASST